MVNTPAASNKKKTIEEASEELNISISYVNDIIKISKNNKHILIHKNQNVYTKTVMYFFDYFFESVAYSVHENDLYVDFSKPRQHKIIGFDTFEPYCPSLAEPYVTIQQYLEFAKIKEGDVVFDLGAYSGLTSIAFSNAAGYTGKVISLEPDSINFDCFSKNLKLANEPHNIFPLNAAVWIETGVIKFSCEQSMGSSAIDIVGERSTVIDVECYTLFDLAKKYNLDKVDFIKCDIEGAESYIFENNEFFDKYNPKIIVEAHYVHGILNTDIFKKQLEDYGYKSRIIEQFGLTLPLVEFFR